MVKGVLITYALSYGGAVVAVVFPIIGYCIYLIFVVLRPQHLWAYALPPDVGWSKYVAIGTIIGVALMILTGRQRTGDVSGTSMKGIFPIVASLVGLSLVIHASAALYPSQTPLGDRFVSDFGKVTTMFVIGLILMNSRSRLRMLLWTFIGAQGYLTVEMNMRYLTSGVNIILMNDGFGTYNNNGFALSLLPGIGLAMMTTIFERRLLWKGIAAAVALSSLHVVLLSESRGAYLGCVAMGLVAFAVVPKNGKTFLKLALIGVMVLVLAGESVQNEFATIFASKENRDVSADSRFDTWSASFSVMMDNLLLGVGPNNFNTLSHLYGLREDKAAHNLYLQTGADFGLIALILLLAFYGTILWKCLRAVPWNAQSAAAMDPTIACAITGALAGLLGYLLHSNFSAGLNQETPYMLVVMSAAAIRMLRVGVGATPVSELDVAPGAPQAIPKAG